MAWVRKEEILENFFFSFGVVRRSRLRSGKKKKKSSPFFVFSLFSFQNQNIKNTLDSSRTTTAAR